MLGTYLKPYLWSDNRADGLPHREVFRYAARHGMISIRECERWWWAVRSGSKLHSRNRRLGAGSTQLNDDK